MYVCDGLAAVEVPPSPNVHAYETMVPSASLDAEPSSATASPASPSESATERSAPAFATGNAAGNAFGKYYPGPGATIGQGLSFSYIAAAHAAGKLAEQQREAVGAAGAP